MKIKKIKNLILDTVFPPLCISCRSHLTNQEKKILLCKSCYGKIKIKTKVHNLDLPLGVVANYNNPVVRKIIHGLKYEKLRVAQKSIETIINAYLKKSDFIGSLKETKWTIIPIPLHKTKERKRGFNQALLISKVLNKELRKYGIKSNIKNILIKNKRTKPQMELSLSDRLGNIKNCFGLKSSVDLNDKNIILVDDVHTTGSTMSEARKVLDKKFTNKTFGFVIAKPSNKQK